jgi:hypothetical protein
VTFSEQFDNAAWIKTATTITANNAVSPDGNTNADLLLETAATSNHPVLSDLFSLVSGTTYTFSVFAKNISGGRGLLQVGGYQIAGSFQDAFANFNLTTEVVTQQTQGTGKIENYGNGWYRCSLTFACTNTVSERLNVTLIDSGTAGFNPSYAGDVSKGLLIWGAQAEAGSYVSSYIPTLGSSVTRVADRAEIINGDGVLPTSYPFTLYVEVDLRGIDDSWVVSLLNRNVNNVYYVVGVNSDNKFAMVSRNITISSIDSDVNATAGTHKLCGVFTDSTIKLFVDGVLLGSGTNNATFNTAANDFLIGQFRINTDTGIRNSVKQAVVFKSELTDTQAIELTA